MLINFNKNVLTKVDEVHDSVEPGLGEDDPADQLVEVDVVVQGQDGGQPEVPGQVGRKVVILEGRCRWIGDEGWVVSVISKVTQSDHQNNHHHKETPEDGDGVAEDKNEDEDRVEEESSATSP